MAIVRMHPMPGPRVSTPTGKDTASHYQIEGDARVAEVQSSISGGERGTYIDMEIWKGRVLIYMFRVLRGFPIPV